MLVVSPSCFKTLFHIPLTYPMCIGFGEAWGHWHSRMPKKVKYGRLNLVTLEDEDDVADTGVTTLVGIVTALRLLPISPL